MRQDEKFQILSRVPLFSSLGESEIQSLAAIVTERNFRTGETMFFESDSPDWFYIVADGMVEILKHSSAGKDFVITLLGANEIVGEVAIVDGAPYPATARARVDTQTLAIKRTDLTAFLMRNPQLLLRINIMLGARLRDVQMRLSGFAIEKAGQRLIRILLMLQLKCGSTIPFTRQEIADMTGITTETTTRIISQLKKRGIIGSTRGRIVILDHDQLKQLDENPVQPSISL
jgi:CRP/FNR family transcriptional regulator, cyclic AMP receptor protein